MVETDTCTKYEGQFHVVQMLERKQMDAQDQ